MSFDVNKNLAFNEIQNKVLFLSNLIKVHSIKIIDSISKEFLLQVF